MPTKEETKTSSSLESESSNLSDPKKQDASKTQLSDTQGLREGVKGRCEILGLTMCMILDPQILYGELHVHYLRGSSDFGYVFLTFILVMPLIFVQIFLGQYTQLGCLYLGRMIPVIHGLGIVMSLMSFYTIVLLLENSDICLHYLFLSLNEPWKLCDDSEPDCVPFTQVLSCIGAECPTAPPRQLSGYLYYREKRRVRSAEMIVYIILLGAIVCGVTILGYRRYRILVKVTLISVSIVTLILIFTTVSLSSSTLYTGQSLRKASLSVTHTNLKGFAETLRKPVLSMEVASAAYILYGNYLSPTHKANICSFSICILYILFIGLGAIFIRLCYYSIMSSAGWAEENDITAMEALYVVIPEYVGSLHVSPLFIMAFYWCCFLLTLTKQVLHTDIISETVIGFFPKLKGYRICIVLCICILAIICTIPYMIMKNGQVPDMLQPVKDFTSLILLEIEFIVIMYFYSYTILSDDIHFAYGSQPAALWKVLWVISPLILFVALVVYDSDQRRKLAFILLVLGSLLPIVIGAIYKFAKAIKDHKALNFVLTEDSWGMKDSFMCKLRKIYNPRDEIRSQRKVDECKHECLIGSEVLTDMIKTEIDINLTVKVEKRVPTTDKEEVLGNADLEKAVFAGEEEARDKAESTPFSTREDVDRFYEELLQKYGIELD